MDFKGPRFEDRIISDLKERNIVVGSLFASGSINKGSERDFQCDLAFILGNELFLCELKAFSQPTTHRGFYELLGKKEEATLQLQSISKFYSENLNLVRSQLGVLDSWSPRKIYKLLIVTTPVGVSRKVNDTFIIDYSAFSMFITRTKPGLTAISKRLHIEFNVFPEFNGEITTEKFIKFLKKPVQVEFEKKRRKQISKGIKYGNFNVKIFDYTTKFDDKISQDDENAKKLILKIGRNVFKSKRRRKR
ncbi:hypothetical protein [Paenibacillus sp. J31TS4]|uniref:hypothetical protein n=1 Tax=Paenibacillus sp. J31TS4 TaxID=2807195 RepID=UPI001BCDE4B5|nr:hypothetical protein [Paenibacillus sp. J31TS4]